MITVDFIDNIHGHVRWSWTAPPGAGHETPVPREGDFVRSPRDVTWKVVRVRWANPSPLRWVVDARVEGSE